MIEGIRDHIPNPHAKSFQISYVDPICCKFWPSHGLILTHPVGARVLMDAPLHVCNGAPGSPDANLTMMNVRDSQQRPGFSGKNRDRDTLNTDLFPDIVPSCSLSLPPA